MCITTHCIVWKETLKNEAKLNAIFIFNENVNEHRSYSYFLLKENAVLSLPSPSSYRVEIRFQIISCSGKFISDSNLFHFA